MPVIVLLSSPGSVVKSGAQAGMLGRGCSWVMHQATQASKNAGGSASAGCMGAGAGASPTAAGPSAHQSPVTPSHRPLMRSPVMQPSWYTRSATRSSRASSAPSALDWICLGGGKVTTGVVGEHAMYYDTLAKQACLPPKLPEIRRCPFARNPTQPRQLASPEWARGTCPPPGSPSCPAPAPSRQSRA